MPREWNADGLLELARSYQPACILTAAADLGLFDILAGGRLSGTDVAKALGADPRATCVLLDALAALAVLEKQDERYVLGSDAARLLRQDSPTSVLSMLQHQASCLRRWAQLAEVVRTGRPAKRRPGARGEQGDEEAFINAMHVVSGPVASELLERTALPTFSHLLDIGGATGTWTIAFLRARPEATATLFDLPHVIPMARRRIAEANLGDRVRFVAGDFYEDPLPSGADLAWLGAIAHQNSREQNRQLFTKVAGALAEGGTLLIRDVLMDNSRTTPVAGALFAINMLVATDGGGTFTPNDFQEDLESAGFTNVSVLRRDEGMNSVVHAVKGRSPA
jgi:hypothetical protein